MGSLESFPVKRVRGVCPHLFCSLVAHRDPPRSRRNKNPDLRASIMVPINYGVEGESPYALQAVRQLQIVIKRQQKEGI
jgi:hypothetical protein